MARALVDDGDISTAQLLFVRPEDVQRGLNSRWKPINETNVEELIISYVEEGQLQPIVIRRVGKTLMVVVGFHRHEAAKRFNELYPEKRMKLQCKLITCNDAEAFTKSIAENRVRSKTTPMDDAHAQRELRERFGVPDKRIAAIYGKTTAHVSLLKKLMALSVENQERVHNGELSLVAGCELAELPETTQAEIVAEAVKATDLESAKVEVQPTSPTPVPTTQQANAPSGSAEAIDQSPKRPGRPRKSPEPPALPKPRQQNLSGKVLGAVKDAKAEAGQSFTRSRADLIAFLSSDFFAARAKPSNMGIAGLLISYLNGKLSDAALMENMNLLSGDD